MQRLTPLLFALFLFACSPQEESKDGTKVPDFKVLRGTAQGSSYRIKYASANAPSDLKARVDSLIDRADATFSMYVDSSGVLDFERAKKGACMDLLFRDLYWIAREVHERTEGAFDPTVKPLVDAWGFGPDERAKGGPDSLEQLLQKVGFDKLRVDTIVDEQGDSCFSLQKPLPEMAFDPNAIAQGFTVDLLIEVLRSEGIQRAMVQLGGEVRTMGKKAPKKDWRIGVEEPKEPGEKRSLKAVAALRDRAMATSGNYRKFYEKDGKRYSHTIDPRTGKPVQHQLLSVTVTHPSCAKADAYATAFMVMGAEKATEFVRDDEKLEAYFIMAKGEKGYKTFATKGMKKLLKSP